MRRFKFSLLSFSVLLSLSFAFNVSAQVRPRSSGGGRVVYADQFPGADLGARINAADASLGAAAGEIVARGGGRISTQIVISSGHTLRLEAGTYAPVTNVHPILLKPRSSLVGAGWDKTIILESTAKDQFTVISAYHNAQRNGSADSDLNLRDFQVRGANPGFNSAHQAVSLGNCSRCTVERVWINGTRSIGIQYGGSSSMGHWAEDSKVVNCLFTRVASQNLALVNGRNILFENNRFIAPGQAGGPGSTTIDLEPNEVADRLENVIIRNNFIDGKDSEMETAGNGIVVQATTGTPHVGNILVEGNTIIGGYNTPTKVTNKMSNGVYVFGGTMKDVRVVNNRITRMGQAGLNMEGANLQVLNNQMTDVGGGGTPGFIIVNVYGNSRIEGNSNHWTGHGPSDGRMVIRGETRGTVFGNNPGFVVTDERRR
ncbi:MAG TPA: right-handed parallel beta-helix repeat-containing protein [Pyrinomonadaceae bacterium]|nr:right-handed parallel beta-helix repeat-containing protein [Pyrinomonadaceae bacterium]